LKPLVSVVNSTQIINLERNDGQCGMAYIIETEIKQCTFTYLYSREQRVLLIFILLKQQSADRYVDPLENIILIPS
jgi:cation transport regulator ChaC